MDNLKRADRHNLKERLINNHSLIEEELQIMSDFLVTKSYHRSNINSLEEKVFAHLHYQSKYIYEWLQENTHNLKINKKILEYLLLDFKQIKIKVLIFFDTAPKNFNSFKNDILTRIQMEKEYLLPILDKISAA